MKAENLKTIRTSQRQLGLTNRALIKLIGLAPADEKRFFAGQFNEAAYASMNQILTTIKAHLVSQSVPLSAYLQQLRALPLHNIFLRNRYAFWLANFIEAGGTATDLVQDAKQNGYDVIKQIVWSSNLLTSTAGAAHLKKHQKQLVPLSDEEYQTIRKVMKRFSTASPLFFFNLEQLYKNGLIEESTKLQQYYDKNAWCINVDELS